MSPPLKCVLIEDNDQNRYLIAYLLQHHGFEMIVADDGVKGLQVVTEARPDVILLDIQLPGMDGYEVARQIKQNPALATTPLVAISSFAMPSDRAKAIKAGFDGYIEKPIDPDTFAAQIKQFMGAT